MPVPEQVPYSWVYVPLASVAVVELRLHVLPIVPALHPSGHSINVPVRPVGQQQLPAASEPRQLAKSIQGRAAHVAVGDIKITHAGKMGNVKIIFLMNQSPMLF